MAKYRGKGGHQPKSVRSAHGDIHFTNGVRGIYAGGPKTTPADNGVEIVGATGRIQLMKGRAELHKGNAPDSFEPIQSPTWPVDWIPAGVRDLVRRLDEDGKLISSGRDGLR